MALALCSVWLAFLLPAASWVADADPWPSDFDKRIAHWEEFQPMANAPNTWSGEHAPFWPSLSWRVQVDNGEVIATPTSSRDRLLVERLLEERHAGMPFKPTVNGSEVADGSTWIAASVPDGWIVALDFGEWGGKVMWVSRDGAKQVDISNDQIQSLIGTSHGVFGIGLGASASQFLPNSLIEISRDSDGKWRTQEVSPFPYNDAAMTMLDNDRLLLGSRTHFFTYDIAGSLNELKNNALPSGWHVKGPHGSSHGEWTFVEDRFYLCQDFVIELDLSTGQRRCLVPDKRFLNDGVRWEAFWAMAWKKSLADVSPLNTATLLARRQLLAKKLAFYEKLQSEFQAQLEGARGRIEQCYKLYPLKSGNTQNHDPFRKLILKNSGRVQEIIFFDGDSDELKACLSDIIQPFQVSPFTDHDTLTVDVNEFRSRILEQTEVFE
jgi:hypothetical protein